MNVEQQKRKRNVGPRLFPERKSVGREPSVGSDLELPCAELRASTGEARGEAPRPAEGFPSAPRG